MHGLPAASGSRRPAVGAHAVGVGVLDLEQVGNPLQQVGDVFVVGGGATHERRDGIARPREPERGSGLERPGGVYSM